MTHVAHQRYAELVDEEVYLDTLQFNAKAHYAILPPFRGSVYLTSVSSERLSELIYADVSVAGAGERIEVARADGEPALPYRVESATSFEPNAAADFDALKRIVSSALMAQPSESGLARMPYPSGGALYSVLTFACRTSAVVNGWAEGDTVFQVQPFARALDSVNIDTPPETLFDALCGGATGQLGKPAFAFVYAVHLDRALFKYRYRGYRVAVMEVGAMYQRVTAEVQARKLRTRVWAGFSDCRVASVLGLDATHVLPMAVQFVGG